MAVDTDGAAARLREADERGYRIQFHIDRPDDALLVTPEQVEQLRTAIDRRAFRDILQEICVHQPRPLAGYPFDLQDEDRIRADAGGEPLSG